MTNLMRESVEAKFAVRLPVPTSAQTPKRHGVGGVVKQHVILNHTTGGTAGRDLLFLHGLIQT